MALNMLVGVLFFFFTIFQCTPVSHFWNRLDLDSGKCIDVWVLIDIAYLYSVGAAITDFTIGILPAFMIWNLRMSRRDKIAVIGVLSLGCMFVPLCARFFFLFFWDKLIYGWDTEQVPPSSFAFPTSNTTPTGNSSTRPSTSPSGPTSKVAWASPPVP